MFQVPFSQPLDALGHLGETIWTWLPDLVPSWLVPIVMAGKSLVIANDSYAPDLVMDLFGIGLYKIEYWKGDADLNGLISLSRLSAPFSRILFARASS